MEARQKRIIFELQEDTRKASENREDAGTFKSGQMFANNQHGQHAEGGFQTHEQ